MHQLTLAEIARGLKDKTFSSVELTESLLARIAQLDPLYVETILPSRMFGKVRGGQTFDVLPELGPSAQKAKVSQVDRVIDAASGTFRVRLLLSNPRFELPSGQRCAINFQL